MKRRDFLNLQELAHLLLRDIRDKRARIQQDDIYQLYEELLPDNLKTAFPTFLMLNVPERNKELAALVFTKKSPANTSISAVRFYILSHPELITKKKKNPRNTALIY